MRTGTALHPHKGPCPKRIKHIEAGGTPKPRYRTPKSHACFVVRHSGQALIKDTAVLQDYLPIGPHLPMRIPHEQAAPHGGRFRSRYESQAAALHFRRHRAQSQRRGSVEQQDACATTTASNSLTFISKMSPAGARRPSCSPRTRRGGLPRTSPSCRSYCGNPKGSSKPLRNNRRSQTRQDEQSSAVNVGRFGLNRPESTTNMDNAMTRALILGATALTLSAGVASAQVAFVSPGRYGDTDIEDYNNPNETMAQRVGLAPTLRRLVTPPR